MARKIRVGILFGGRSAEHEVSLLSARSIVASIDRDKYEPVLVGIDRSGAWHLGEGSLGLLAGQEASSPPSASGDEQVTLVPGTAGGQIISLEGGENVPSLDVIFPVLHGPFGEDGTVQGMLKLAGIPFVGAGVLGSAIGMDKDVMKRLLRDAGIGIGRFMTAHRYGWTNPDFASAALELGLPIFIKPANLGSSVGIHKVRTKEEFDAATEDAFSYDTKILIEEFIDGREIEVSVLGNDQPIASIPGEILPSHEFYSYQAKYLDEHGAALEIPANLPEDTVRRIQDVAIQAFRVLCCEGMARVDFFLRKENEILVNEINTIPGFTPISMYPKLWEASGISNRDLIDRLITLAIERFEREKRLSTNFRT
jgi:D-alanine-D-alanine ligase